MKNEWKDWLYFSKSERRGIFVLLTLLLALVFLPKLFPLFTPKTEAVDYEARYEELLKEAELAKTEKAKQYSSKKTSEKSVSTSKKESLQTATVAEETDQREDKTTSSTFAKKEEPKQVVSPKKQTESITININTAAAEDFAKLRGIGEVYSNRIVKFRNALGGFVSVSQVGTTYGIEPETFSAIRKQLTIQNGFQPKKININISTVVEMKRHPYISEKLAQQIVNYREKVHPFKTEEDVKSLYFMNDELFGKLRPYLVW